MMFSLSFFLVVLYTSSQLINPNPINCEDEMKKEMVRFHSSFLPHHPLVLSVFDENFVSDAKKIAIASYELGNKYNNNFFYSVIV
jgi:hypothetical protein